MIEKKLDILFLNIKNDCMNIIKEKDIRPVRQAQL